MPSTRKELLTKVSMSLHGYQIQTALLKRDISTRPSDQTARTESAGDADIGQVVARPKTGSTPTMQSDKAIPGYMAPREAEEDVRTASIEDPPDGGYGWGESTTCTLSLRTADGSQSAVVRSL